MQGSLEMWVDILPPPMAKRFALIDITPPPPQLFEIRLIVWRTKEVQYRNKILRRSELFVRAWVEGCERQKTDVHLRCVVLPTLCILLHLHCASALIGVVTCADASLARAPSIGA